MKHVATIKWCAQVGIDDWAMVTRHLEIKPETTAKDIIDWMKRFDRGHIGEFVVREVDEK
jgi:hypothetical protein